MDTRIFCNKCAQDIRDAGYKLLRTDKKVKEECDKCHRQGYEYILKR